MCRVCVCFVHMHVCSYVGACYLCLCCAWVYCVCMHVLVCGCMVKRDLFTLHLIGEGSFRWSGRFHYSQSGYPACSRAFLCPRTIHWIEGRLSYPPSIEVILEIPPSVIILGWLIYVLSHIPAQYLGDFSWINFSCSRKLAMWGDSRIVCYTE